MSLLTLTDYLDREDVAAVYAERAIEWATDRVTDDIASYTAWLSDQCGHADRITFGHIPRDAVALADLVLAATVPQLVALTLYPRTATATAAAHELRDRYIKAETTQAYIAQVAARYEPEVA